MTRIEKIEKLLNEWKASWERNKKSSDFREVSFLKGGVYFGEEALKIVKEPSNTQMHVDTKPCAKCQMYVDCFYDFKFCGDCGRALSQ